MSALLKNNDVHDEKQNRKMIDDWLKKNKVTVIEPSIIIEKELSKELINDNENIAQKKVKRAPGINEKFQNYFRQVENKIKDETKELTACDFDKVEHYFDYYEALKIVKEIKK